MDDRPPIETPGLDAFLEAKDAALPVRLTPTQLAAMCREAHSSDPEDPALQPHILVALWRFARAIGIALGRVAEDETLELALDGADPCPWRTRLVPRPRPSERAQIRAGAVGGLYRMCSDGLTLLPPADPALAETWCEAFELVAQDLAMKRSPRGHDVIRVLSDPAAVTLVSCSAEALMELEDLISDQALRVLTRHGETAVADHFREQYGLCRREGLALVALARARATRYGRSSVEDDRALMVASLRDILARARETLNIGEELRALRELARVQGLTRTDPEDRQADILGVIERVGRGQDARLLPEAAAQAALEAAPVREVELAPRDLGILEEFDAAEQGR